MKAFRGVLLTLIGVAIAMVVAQNLNQPIAVIVLGQAGPTLPLGILLLVCFGAGLILGSILWLMQGWSRRPRTRRPAPLPSPTPTWPDREPAPYTTDDDERWPEPETTQDDEQTWR